MSSFEEILRREGTLVYKTRGTSMEPLLRQDRDLVIIRAPEARLKKGDVALYRRGESYVLHRVMSVSDTRVELMGDGNVAGREICRPEDVLARADEVVGPDGRHRRLDTPKQRRRARLWRRLLPVRRWILAVYKRTIIRNLDIQ